MVDLLADNQHSIDNDVRLAEQFKYLSFILALILSIFNVQ